MVHWSAAVVPAAVGVSASFQEDLGALQVPVHYSHIQGSLPLDVHQVHLGPFAYEEVHTVAMACSGCNPQWGAGEPAAAPDRLLIDAAIWEDREFMRVSLGRRAVLPPLTLAEAPKKDSHLGSQSSRSEYLHCILFSFPWC